MIFITIIESMNEFNYTEWMQQNKVGPNAKTSLKESHEANDKWYEDFQDGLRNLVNNKYIDKYSYKYYVDALDHIDPMDNYSHLSGHDAAKEFIDDLRTQSAMDKDREKFKRETGLEENESERTSQELKEANVLKEQSGDNEFTAEVTVDIVFDEGAVYEGKQLKYRFYSDVTTMKVNYLIDMEFRSWGLKSVAVYAPSGEPDIEFDIEVAVGENDTDTITFKGAIDWSKVNIEREDDEEGFLINPHTIELQFDKNCKFDQGTVTY